MIVLLYREKNYDDMLSCFHTIPACHGQSGRQIDRRTDGRTELLYQYRAIMLTRDSQSLATDISLYLRNG